MPPKYRIKEAAKSPSKQSANVYMVNSTVLLSADPSDRLSKGLPACQNTLEATQRAQSKRSANQLLYESSQAVVPDLTLQLPPPNITTRQTHSTVVTSNGMCGTANNASNVTNQINLREDRMNFPVGETRRQPNRWRQHLAALLAALSAVSVGYVDAWTANALPFLQASTSTLESSIAINISFKVTTRLPSVLLMTSIDPDNDSYTFLTTNAASLVFSSVAAITDRPTILKVDSTDNVVHGISSEEASWLSSLVPIGAMLGSIPAGILADQLGRKLVLLYMVMPCLISWMIILFGSHSLVWLFLARGIQGVVMGIVLVVVPLYNEEISEVEVRGAIGVYQNMMVTVGILLCYLVGAFVSYRWTAVIPCAVPITMFFSFIWMPESPVYLRSKNRFTEAFQGLLWLRGEKLINQNTAAVLNHNLPHGNEQMQEYPLEIIELEGYAQRNLQYQEPTQRPVLERTPSLGCLQQLAVFRLVHRASVALTQRSTAFPLIIVFALMLFRQLTGIHAVVFYTVEIFSGARSSLPHAYEAIVIGAVEVAATYAASRLVDRVGRRPLLLASGAGTAACHAGLAIYFYCLGAGVTLVRYSWLPLVLLSLFIVLQACGFGPLPWFMMAELTPADHKNWATGVTGFLNWGSMFLVLKLFPTMTEVLGDCFTFTVFAVNCAMACSFVYFFVPETKGKTLQQIQEEIVTGR